MRLNPAETWLGTVITLDVTAWFVWLAALAIARRTLDAGVPTAGSTADE